MNTKIKNPAAGLLSLILILIASAFSLFAIRHSEFDFGALITGGILIALILAHFIILTAIYPQLDRQMMLIVYLLASIGMIMQYRINPDIAFKQLMWVGIGMLFMCFTMLLLRSLEFWKRLSWIAMILSIGMLLVVLLIGRTTGGAKNWINLAGFSFQSSEFVKIILVFVLATWLSERRGFQLLPLIIYVAILLGLLALSRDLGAAVLFALTSIIVFYIATGNVLMTLGALTAGAGAAFLSYQIFDHVKVRVVAWKNPWISYQTNGYQIAQGLMAIASGGLFGMGLTRGSPKIIPAYHTDYIFAVICEEMGIIVGICVIAFYLLLIIRAMSIAMNCSSQYPALLASGVISMLALQTFLILGGVIKFIPLTGVTLPFVSYGGSSMISSFIMLGVLQVIAVQSKGEMMDQIRGGIAR